MSGVVADISAVAAREPAVVDRNLAALLSDYALDRSVVLLGAGLGLLADGLRLARLFRYALAPDIGVPIRARGKHLALTIDAGQVPSICRYAVGLVGAGINAGRVWLAVRLPVVSDGRPTQLGCIEICTGTSRFRAALADALLDLLASLEAVAAVSAAARAASAPVAILTFFAVLIAVADQADVLAFAAVADLADLRDAVSAVSTSADAVVVNTERLSLEAVPVVQFIDLNFALAVLCASGDALVHECLLFERGVGGCALDLLAAVLAGTACGEVVLALA